MVDGHDIEQTKVLHHPQVTAFLEMREDSAVVEKLKDNLSHRTVVWVEDSQGTAELLTYLMSETFIILHGGVVVDPIGVHFHLADVRLVLTADPIEQNSSQETHLIGDALPEHAAKEVQSVARRHAVVCL